MEFRCLAPSSTAEKVAFPCFNSGNCTSRILDDGSSLAMCQCPPGFKPDNVGFGHFDNCSLPDKYLAGYFIAYTCIAVPLNVVQLLFLRRSRQYAKSIQGYRNVATTVLWQWMSWIHVLCVFAQDGFFEAALLSLAAYICIGYLISAQLLSTFLRPHHLLGRFNRSVERLRQMLWVVLPVVALSVSSTLLAAIPYARSENPSRYNAALFSMILLSVVAIALTQTLTIVSGRRLLRFLRNASMHESYSSTKFSDAQARIRLQIRWVLNLCASFFVGDCFALGVICVWGVYGSFPYLFIGWSVQFALSLATYPLTFTMIGRLVEKDLAAGSMTGLVDPTESVERRGFETIVIQNNTSAKNPISKWKSKFARRNQLRIGSDRRLPGIAEEQNEISSKVI